jgi:predicted nucleic acid-binding protein
MIGIDTSAIIDMFKEEKLLLEVLKNINDEIISTIVNYQEVLFGLDLLNPKHLIEFNYYESFFNEMEIMSLSKKASQKSAEISWYLKKKGIIIDNFDCMVAGILLVNGINEIITRNKKHFEHIPGLKVISY